MSYVVPQVQVFQDVTQVPTAVVSALNPMIYGANYSLRRYTEAAEKALIGIGEYDPVAGNTAAYPSLIGGSVVDQDYVKVYTEDAWLKYIDVPNAAANPVYMVSATDRNKLRAAPRIVDGGQISGVTMNTKGYHTGTIALPEAYYFTPSATFALGADAGVFNYITSEDATGTMSIPANATTAGVVVQGPDGLAMDFDVPDTVVAPRSVIFETAAPNAGSFSITPKSSRMKDHIDDAIDSTLPLQVNVTTGALAATYTEATRTLAIAYQNTDPLITIRAALATIGGDAADFAARFDVGAISGVGTGTSATCEDGDGVTYVAAGDVPFYPDCFKVLVYENTWIFKTANGISRTASLYKDVEVGDYLKYTVTPASTGVEVSGYSKIVGLEPDYSSAALADAAADADNQATQAGEDLSVGAVIVSVGPDNEKTPDFDMATTLAYALDLTDTYMIGSLADGVIDDTITLTVTKAGVKGVAEVRVTSLSGKYTRSGVLVEDIGGNEGQVYCGRNVFVDFVAAGGGDGIFHVGDTYVVTSPKTPFTIIAAPAITGTYTGSGDTSYQVEVTRGGVFDRVAVAIPGLTTNSDVTLVPSIAGWLGGDVDDEYVLKCTTGGTINTAVFSLTSQRGDNVSAVSFVGYGAGNAVTVGASGLSLYLTNAVPSPVFTAGEYFVVVAKAARPKVRVSDSAGIDQEITSIVADGDTIAMGLNGGYLTFPANLNTLGGIAPNGGLITGDVFTVEATASAPGAVQTIIIADELPVDVAGGQDEDGDAVYEPDRFALELMLVSASKEIPKEDEDPGVAPGDYNWETTADEVAVRDTIKLQDSRWVDLMGEMPYIELKKGNLFVQYRSLLLTYSDAIYSTNDLSDVLTKLGPAVPENPLSLAVYTAVENIGRGLVYYTAIPSDDATGDAAALAKASLTADKYAFNPAGVLSTARHSVLEAHVNTMSTETTKRWRVGFVGRETPSTEDVLTATTNPGHVDWKATVTLSGGVPKKVTLTEDGGLLANLKAGDTVRLQFTVDAWGRTTYVTDTVASVSSNTVFYLTSGLAAEVLVAAKVEAYHPLSVQEQADAVKAISEGYANKRIYHVFPGNLGKYGIYVNAAYGAAAVAGLVGSVVPQQGLTNVAINGFDDIPDVYGKYSYDQLNTIASGGTLILMQDTKGGEIYVRHQVSTALADGNLNTTELSLVKNLDSISYYFADSLKPFIGRYNVTPELLSVIKTQVQDGINYLGSYTNVSLLGPQVILENGNSKIRSIAQHPTLKDRVVAIIDLELPAPLNVIEFHIVV